MTQGLFDKLFDGKDPTRLALIDSDGEQLDYGALQTRSARLAHQLVDAGVQIGDRVAVQVEKSGTALLLYLACLRAGAVYLPLNTGYTTAELGYFVRDAEPSLIVVDPERQAAATAIARSGNAALRTLAADGHSGTLLEGMAQQSEHFATIPRQADDLAAILYTSGTTGRSKGAMLTHGNLVSNAATLVDAWHFTDADHLLHALPIYHTHGLFVATNVTWLAGGVINLLPKFALDDVFDALETATVMMGVPTYYTRLLADPRLTREATANIRLFTSGSAPLLAETHRAWKEATGHIILERYGMTETNMNCSNPYDGERRAGTVGPPLAGVELRVVHEQSDAPLKEGEVGMIEVRGPNVFAGYWQMPDKTAAEMREDGFFITGDLGCKSPDGYVEIVGRSKDLVITGGLNVYPKEVETAIDAIAGVLESAVIGVPHADFGEAVTAVVVRQDGASVSEQEILATLALTLAKFKLPKSIRFAPELPRNAMGKVQKNLLRNVHVHIFMPA